MTRRLKTQFSGIKIAMHCIQTIHFPIECAHSYFNEIYGSSAFELRFKGFRFLTTVSFLNFKSIRFLGVFE